MVEMGGTKILITITICIILISIGLCGCVGDDGKKDKEVEEDAIIITMTAPELSRGFDSYNVTLGPITDKEGFRIRNRNMSFIFNESIEYNTQLDTSGLFWFNVSKKIIKEFEGKRILWTISGYDEEIYLIIYIGDTSYVKVDPNPINL